MTRLIRFFKQPFPYFKKRWKVVALISICVCTVLVIVLSFNAYLTSFLMVALFVGGFTLISAICSSVLIYLLPIPFKRFFDERRWTTGKLFILAIMLCLMIGVANTLYDYFVMKKVFYYDDYTFFKYFIINLLTAFTVGIVPTVVGYFWLRNQWLHSSLQEKEDQNRKLTFRVQRNGLSDDKKIITLYGNTKDSLTLFPRELLYIESLSNYVYIYYLIDNQVLQKKLRATLLQMENLLREYPFMVRCHRAFIVNIHQIESVRGLKLHVKSTEAKVPVSKNYKSDLQKQLKSAGCFSQI